MKINNLTNMTRGWFIGNFLPTLWSTKEFEVAIQRYEKGDFEKPHVHKIATEINVIIEGSVSMNDIIYNKNDIITIEPGEKIEFKSITDSTLVVVKIPCVIGDKYTD
jgi:mannose-6-phosphate isomerase-like protein (cupin superfamily)